MLTHEERRARRERAVTLLRKGHTAEEVAAVVGLAAGTVTQIGYLAGVVARKRARASANTMAILAALARGETQSDIARRLGCSRQYVHSLDALAREAGVALPRVDGRKKKKK
jgi:DNA-binding NarL/FixJ family response regulator